MNEEPMNDETPVTTPEELEVAGTKPKAKLGRGGIIAALRAAVAGGGISSTQAKRMRGEMGILQGEFTRKPFNHKKARAAGKRAKLARKANRGTFKGQKMTGGSRK